ncbi:MAG: hypothetical protein KDA95_02500 [Acidimicrobiales bacterium]|nr:hypothetical protein [Acidimicrobiales bacterium]
MNPTRATNYKLRKRRSPWSIRRPVLFFVIPVCVIFVLLYVIALSGVANPRLSGGNRAVTINGNRYERVVIRNDSPTNVTIDAARYGMDTSGKWQKLFEYLSTDCASPNLVPYKPRTLKEGESLVVVWLYNGARYTSDRVEVRARTRSGLTRVTTLPRGPDFLQGCTG